MHYHFNYPYYPAAWQEEDQGIIPNGCVTQGTNGTKYGYDSSVPIGANTPDTIKATGQLVYANYWLADGTFIMPFGDLGNEPIPDVEFIFTVINGTLLQYVWKPDTLLYEASNLTLATQLITDYVEDEDVCYTSLPLLQEFISYDFNLLRNPNAYYKNNTSYSPNFDAISANGTGLVLGATNSLPLDTLIGGYLTYQTGDLVVTQLQEGVDFTGSTYTLVDDTYRWAYVNENPFSEADLTAIAEESNKIVEFAFDGTGLTNTQGVDDKFYGFRENSGAYCVDALAGYGVENVDNTFLAQTTGTNNTNVFDGTDTFTIHNETDTALNFRPSCDFNPTDWSLIQYVSILVTVTSGTVFLKNIENKSIISLNLTLNAGDTYSFEGVFGYVDSGGQKGSVIFDGNAESVFDATVTIKTRTATASEIADYADSIRTATANSQTSIQWTCAELDGAGVPTAYNSTPNTAIMHSDTSISTGFKPNIGQYSIEETITGNLAVLDVNGDPTGSFTQRTEARLLTHEEGVADKYYINSIEQAVVPALPNPDTAINLNNVAIIGYPDLVDSREADFKVHSEIITP